MDLDLDWLRRTGIEEQLELALALGNHSSHFVQKSFHTVHRLDKNAVGDAGLHLRQRSLDLGESWEDGHGVSGGNQSVVDIAHDDIPVLVDFVVQHERRIFLVIRLVDGRQDRQVDRHRHVVPAALSPIVAVKPYDRAIVRQWGLLDMDLDLDLRRKRGDAKDGIEELEGNRAGEKRQRPYHEGDLAGKRTMGEKRQDKAPHHVRDGVLCPRESEK